MPVVNISYFADLADGDWLRKDPNRALQALDDVVRASRSCNNDLWIVNGFGGDIVAPGTVSDALAILTVGAREGEFEDYELTINPPASEDSLEDPAIPTGSSSAPGEPTVILEEPAVNEPLSIVETPGELAEEGQVSKDAIPKAEEVRTAPTQRAANVIRGQRAIEEFNKTRIIRLQDEAGIWAEAFYGELEERIVVLQGCPHVFVPGGKDVIPSCMKTFAPSYALAYYSAHEALGVRVYGLGAEVPDTPQLAQLLQPGRKENGTALGVSKPDIIVWGQIAEEQLDASGEIKDRAERDLAKSSSAARDLLAYLDGERGKVIFMRNPLAEFMARVINGNLFIQGTSFSMKTTASSPGSFVVGRYEKVESEEAGVRAQVKFSGYVLQLVPRGAGGFAQLGHFDIRQCYRIAWDGNPETVEIRMDRKFIDKNYYDQLESIK